MRCVHCWLPGGVLNSCALEVVGTSVFDLQCAHCDDSGFRIVLPVGT